MPDNMGPDFTARFKAVFPEAAKESEATLTPFIQTLAELLKGAPLVSVRNSVSTLHRLPRSAAAEMRSSGAGG